VQKLAFSPDGRSIALGYGNGKIEVVDPSTGKARQQYPGIASNVTSVAFSPDGRYLAASGEDAEATPVPQPILDPIKTFLDANQQPTRKVVKVWHVVTRDLFRVIHGPHGPVAFSGDNRLLATGPFDARYKSKRPVALWNVESGKIASVVEDGDVPHGFGPDGETLATSGGGIVRIWDASIRKERQVIPLCDPGGQINHVAFSPTGRYLATANGNGTVYIVKIRWP
jgi:WD40 repeat protein